VNELIELENPLRDCCCPFHAQPHFISELGYMARSYDPGCKVHTCGKTRAINRRDIQAKRTAHSNKKKSQE